MSEYANKLASLAGKKQKLLDDEKKLIGKCKISIGNLAERCDVLIVSDSILAGLFVELSQALKDKSPRLKEWETLGARFLKPRKTQSGVSKFKIEVAKAL